MALGQGNTRRRTELGLLFVAALPVTLLYAMYVVTLRVPLSFSSLSVPLGLCAAFAFAHLAIRRLAPGADPALLPIVLLLSGVGIAFVTRLAPDEAVRQVIWLFVSVAAMVITLIAVPNLDELAEYKYTMGIAGVILLIMPMIFGVEINGSKLWLKLGPFSFQPGELSKILIILCLAAYLAENRELLSASMRRFGPITLPRGRMLLPVFTMWGMSILVVIFERDLGSALLLFTFFVTMLYVCTGRVSYVVVSLLLLALGAFMCFNLFDHVHTRVEIWLDPFKDARGKGYQIVQSLYSLADGGLIGTGIGKGMPTLIPEVKSDCIFSAIGEECGLLGGSAVLIAYMLFAIRGFATAARAKSDVSSFTAAGLTAAITVQAFLIVAGVTKLLPLTGITLPFMSQGGSSLLASFILVGLLLRAGDEATGHETQLEMLPPVMGPQTTAAAPEGTGRRTSHILHGAHVRGRYGMLTPESGVLGRVALGKRLTALVTVLTLLFAVLITNLTYVQVIEAEELRTRPNNNHTIAKSEQVHRGAIVTSDGVTLAESVLADDGSTYVRQYPAGSLASHTVGYLSTRYGASGIESRFNEALIGRTDYSTWNSALWSLAGVSQPGSSVVLTINSQMQQVCEAYLAGYVGAIVVLDPTTGAVLAKASAPTYSYDQIPQIMNGELGDGVLLDRTSGVLYAPGSTFKTITLAAALEQGVAKLDSSYPAPAALKIGQADITNVNGEEWESLTLREALAYSANTVYGQVSQQLGASKLVSYAENFGYDTKLGQDFDSVRSLMPSPGEMTEWETAWSACGQPVGEHPSPAGPQATVMQNAVMIAAIANNGMAMEPYIVDHILSPEGISTNQTQPRMLSQAVNAKTASQVKDALLDVVEYGSGQYAQIGNARVAGKTGTAETSSSTANSLFVGFAPFDQPTLAISVCIEGGDGQDVQGVATSIAGEVLSQCLDIQQVGV